MGPVSQHLRTIVPELPSRCVDSQLRWTFADALKTFKPSFYNKILPLHPILNVEYSVLCNQLRQDFLDPKIERRAEIIERLNTALLFCELLEQVHLHYLVVPREVLRLRKQQELFRLLLSSLAGYSFTNDLPQNTARGVDLFLSQRIRDATMQANWYRILANRSKRVLDVLNTVLTNSSSFNNFVFCLGKYTNPFLAYFGFLFHMPRLLTNTFLLVKHTLPGAWMGEAERSLAWTTRLYSQIQRRWFEMGNDAVWTAVSALNLFLFVGALATGAVYLSAVAFAFDMIYAAARAYVELKRLYQLHDEYTVMAVKENNPLQQAAIRTHLQHLEQRIRFEQYRFSLHVSGTSLIFLAMGMALPVFALAPTVVLATAIFLLLLWAINYVLTLKLDNYRPKETIEVSIADSEMTASVSKLGLFARTKQRSLTRLPSENESSPDEVSEIEVAGLTSSPPLFI